MITLHYILTITGIIQGSFITLVPDKQFHVGESTLLRLSDDELKMLAMELRANEYKLRSGLTPLYLMQALADHDQPEFPTSLNTIQVLHSHFQKYYSWVQGARLCHRLNVLLLVQCYRVRLTSDL